MHPTWIALFLALHISSIAFGAGPGTSLPAVAPDNSLTPKEYNAIGFPPLDTAWTSSRYERAIGVLKKLASEDLTKLPRHRSPKSGDVFEKLISVRGIQSDNPVEVYSEGVLTLNRVNQVLQVYQVGIQQNIWFGMELARIFYLLLQSDSEVLAEINAIIGAIDTSDPTYATRIAGLMQFKFGIYQQLDGILMVLDDPTLPPEERTAFMKALGDFGPKLIDFLSSEHQQALMQHIRQLAKSVSPEDQALLARLVTAERANPRLQSDGLQPSASGHR